MVIGPSPDITTDPITTGRIHTPCRRRSHSASPLVRGGSDQSRFVRWGKAHSSRRAHHFKGSKIGGHGASAPLPTRTDARDACRGDSEIACHSWRIHIANFSLISGAIKQERAEGRATAWPLSSPIRGDFTDVEGSRSEVRHARLRSCGCCDADACNGPARRGGVTDQSRFCAISEICLGWTDD